MTSSTVRTRFAPSPSGALHLGSARTALLNWLHARHHGGTFVLRSEDTDVERSSDAALAAIEADLAWLGLAPDEGPGAGGARAPYRQSERAARHAALLESLVAADRAYPCFCTREELAAVRERQLAAGEAPRYPGTCARLDSSEQAARRAAGRPATLRFRVPASGEITFTDLVHGERRFALDAIGDFVIARADGTPAFFFANAVDDADMGITTVLRGDDHLTNTPRQLLVLAALALDAPAYGHFGLLTGDDGKPLSKRTGAAAIADLRAQGYRPEAVRAHLARVGVSGLPSRWLDDDELAATFTLERLARGPARHDAASLAGWQRKAVDRLSTAALVDWIERSVGAPWPDRDSATAFVEAVRPNILLPPDAAAWAERVFSATPPYDPEAAEVIRQAGGAFWQQARATTEPSPSTDFAGWAKAVGAATHTRGRGLFRPLRAALTGTTAGPELAALVPLLPAGAIAARLTAAARMASDEAPHAMAGPGTPN